MSPPTVKSIMLQLYCMSITNNRLKLFKIKKLLCKLKELQLLCNSVLSPFEFVVKQ